ncbi:MULTISPECIES: VTT domain-containing protein [unclassified Clostridium]|uniref:TVP38/TMEM64 family protein n=1 Tax=Clostridium TaxID=1485 RepID=UPI001C8C1D7A|nr:MULTISPECIES: VTT domain-containing protein [unclassified Clostridium]MBX9138011.1 TVP38/TMEM64 family protein [Clostridium sp. K12(2020)]MBX9144521.1 TVP38/TMEM64 family protein [Clostridium sp. K13]MDU2289974.1 VTT domain-containing protein [Clostridium celatum]MDU4324470.1 VTT domain-containing protein [Clostridium celatum]
MQFKKLIYIFSACVLAVLLVLGISMIGKEVNIDFSLESLRGWIEGNPLSEVFFIGLWSIRLIAFIPGVTLMLLGGLIFEPNKAFVLSLLGIVISDAIVFAIAKVKILSGLRKRIENKYPEVISLLEAYNYKILGIGVLCPVAPTDAIVFLSSYMGISFSKFLLVFIGANLPALFLYSYLGQSFDGSIFNTIMIVVTLTITGIFSVKLWNELKFKLVHEN